MYRSVKAGERVSDEEYERLEVLLTMFALRLENLMIQYRLQPVTLENLDETLENIFDHWVKLLTTSPSSKDWWRHSRTSFTLEFTTRLDRQIRKDYRWRARPVDQRKRSLVEGSGSVVSFSLCIARVQQAVRSRCR